MTSNCSLRKLALTVGFMTAGLSSSQGDVLYAIESFNNNATDAEVWWTEGITTITVAPGLTGTTEEELLTLQTMTGEISPKDLSGAGGNRFRNGEPTQNSARGTLTTDLGRDNEDRFWQCGVSGSAMGLTNLTFDAVRATGGDSVRGYEIDISIDGGDYTTIATADITNNRGAGLESFEIPINLSATNSIDVRFYASGGGIEWTNIAINGSYSGTAGITISEIGRNNNGSVDLTWNSSAAAGTTYAILATADLGLPLDQWIDVDDSVATGGETTNANILPETLPADAAKLFFVVVRNSPSAN